MPRRAKTISKRDKATTELGKRIWKIRESAGKKPTLSRKTPWREKQDVEIANRLREAREFLGLSQGEFARQVAITRERLASYEDCRAPLRCDIGLRICRHFFVSELWLACGSVTAEAWKKDERAEFSNLDARLTMSLATEPVGLSLPVGISFAEGFKLHLAAEYDRLEIIHLGMPRINPLPSDHPAYVGNAISCLLEFWKRGLTPADWRRFIVDLVSFAKNGFEFLRMQNPSGTSSDDLKLFEEERRAMIDAAWSGKPPKK